MQATDFTRTVAEVLLASALQHFLHARHISLYLCHNLVEKERRRGIVGRLEVL